MAELLLLFRKQGTFASQSPVNVHPFDPPPKLALCDRSTFVARYVTPVPKTRNIGVMIDAQYFAENS